MYINSVLFRWQECGECLPHSLTRNWSQIKIFSERKGQYFFNFGRKLPANSSGIRKCLTKTYQN